MRLIALVLAATLAACGSSTPAGGGATTTDAGSKADAGSETDGGSKSDTVGSDTATGKDTASDTGSKLDPLSQLMQDLLDLTGAPGVSVASAQSGEVMQTQALGLVDVDETTALGTNHVMRWGDASQLVVAVAVMQQVEAGKLDLDADVSTYVGFTVKNPKHDGKVTLRSLLAHASSAQDTEAAIYDVPQPGDATQTLADFAKGYFAQADAWADVAPGAEVALSYTGAALAALAVEKVTGKDFALQTKEQLFAPIGLKSTGWHKGDVGQLAWPHGFDDAENIAAYEEPYGMPYYPAVTLYAPPAELAKLLSLFTNKGTVAGKQLLKPASVDEVLKEQFPKAKNSDGMGLVWWPTAVGDAEVPVWAALGYDWGWTAAILLSDDRKNLSVVAINLEVDPTDELIMASFDALSAALLTGKTP